VLRALYEAFGRGDLAGVNCLFTPDATFHQPGRNPISGDYRGVAEILRLLRSLAERSGGTFRGSVHDVLGSGNHAVGLLRVTASRQDRQLDMAVVHVAHVSNGLITEVWVHPQDQYAVDAFWA
jgi:hypothetical protein